MQTHYVAPSFPAMCGEVICCTPNTEVLEVPNKDDILKKARDDEISYKRRRCSEFLESPCLEFNR